MTPLHAVLHLRSPLGTPLAGDTLFGQLCHTCREIHGEARLDDLLTGYGNGQPWQLRMKQPKVIRRNAKKPSAGAGFRTLPSTSHCRNCLPLLLQTKPFTANKANPCKLPLFTTH